MLFQFYTFLTFVMFSFVTYILLDTNSEIHPGKRYSSPKLNQRSDDSQRLKNLRTKIEKQQSLGSLAIETPYKNQKLMDSYKVSVQKTSNSYSSFDQNTSVYNSSVAI